MLAGQRPQALVPAFHWQQARSLGAWTLVGCTVAPGFEFAGFEVAAPGWWPPAGPTPEDDIEAEAGDSAISGS